MAMIARLLTTNLIFNIRLNRSASPAAPSLVAILDGCRIEMRLRYCPSLLITNAVDAPAVSGIFRPAILLPAHFANPISESQLRLIFLHELAHVKRHDVAMDWLWAILQSLHWFNPILWLIAPLRRIDREQARDQMVLNIAGPEQSQAYGQILLSLSQSAKLPILCPGLVGIVTGKRNLQRRIKMIAEFHGASTNATCAGFLLLAIAGCCAMTNAQTAKAPATSSAAILNSVTAPTTQADGDGQIETRRYDVKDLLFVAPDYGGPPYPSTRPTDPEEEARTWASRMADIKTYVEENVAYSTWKEQGGAGTVGLESDAGVLVIRQTPGHHAEIQTALDGLRHSRGSQNTLEIRLLTLDESDLRKLPPLIHQHIAALSGAGRNRTDQVLTPDEAKQLVNCVNKLPAANAIASPRLTMFDKQHATLIVQTSQAYVDSMTRTHQTGKGPSPAFEPHVATTTATGIVIQLSVCDSPDRSSVFVDVHPQLARLLDLVPQHWPDAPANVEATIQHPISVKYERRATCAIPDRGTLLLGGFTQVICGPKPDDNLLPLGDTAPKVDGSGTLPAHDASVQSRIDREQHRQVFMLVTPTILRR